MCVCIEGTNFDRVESRCLQFTDEICSERGQFFNFDDEVCEYYKVCGESYELDESLNMCFEVQFDPMTMCAG